MGDFGDVYSGFLYTVYVYVGAEEEGDEEFEDGVRSGLGYLLGWGMFCKSIGEYEGAVRETEAVRKKEMKTMGPISRIG